MKKGRKLFSREERAEILKKTGFRCAHCGKSIDENNMTVEHIFPFSKGGDHSEFNLTALCFDCNSDKSNFVYTIDAYYKYILPEYQSDYKNYFIKLKSELIDSEQVIGFESAVYEIISSENYRMVALAYKRNKKKAMELLNKVSIRLKLERAYPGQAKDIVKFILKMRDKYNQYISIYDNEYIIMDHMQKGRVLILTNALGEIFGVYIFLKEKYVNSDFPQLNNICEVTGLHKTYIMTLAICNDKARRCQGEILADFFVKLIDRKSLPLYFNIIGFNDYSSNYDYMELPVNIQHENGSLQLMTIKGIKDFLADCMQHSIDCGDITEQEVEDIIQKTLSAETICSINSLKQGEANGKDLYRL